MIHWSSQLVIQTLTMTGVASDAQKLKDEVGALQVSIPFWLERTPYNLHWRKDDSGPGS